MGLIDKLALLIALLIGGAGGWLVATARHHRLAERERNYEREVADYQELYAAWAMLRRTRCADAPENYRADQ
jgi:hypothetical protein